MKKIAHLDAGREQSIKEHLENVAKQAAEFSRDYEIAETDAEEYAYETGLAHDLGKYSERFQEKIRENRNISVDHSTAGAKELQRLRMPAAAFAVAGHHGGIPNGWDVTGRNLRERLKNRELEPYTDFMDEISLRSVREPELSSFEEAFFTRMIFSALVDADFLDTERFMRCGRTGRGEYESISVLYGKLAEHIRPWRTITEKTPEINKIRTGILEQCLEEGRQSRGLYRLTVPTGGGKTVSSLAFALLHARENGMKRVIYVVPYTSIIEQTVDVFREILGERNVLAHVSGSLLDSENEEKDIYARHRLSIENWDAPVIVTTSVQFFESLYSNKVSKCRKLHNIANSVIVFDEAQMIPLSYLKPCLKAIQVLVESYRVSAVLCTATQPGLENFMKPLAVREICRNCRELFQYMKRTQIRDAAMMSEEDLVQRLSEESQVLAIVNTKKEARDIFLRLSGEGSYHLSTYMTPADRKRTLKVIRERLKKGEACRVVSTSLVEAGVDLDFPTVYREMAGLDSIIQAAGRCNREGIRPYEESVVWVFRMGAIPRMIEKNAAVTEETLEKYGEYDSEDAIRYYFSCLQNLDEEALDRYHITESFEKGLEGAQMPFQTVAERFHLIDDNTKMLIIPIEQEAEELVDELNKRIKNQDNFRETIQRLGKYAVNLYEKEYQELLADNGAYEPTDGIAVLQTLSLYQSGIGFCYEKLDGATIV